MTPEQRLFRLEARADIRELVARYCFTIDDRDVAGIGECFTRGGSFRSLDGVMDAVGREAVVAQFHGRFAVLGPSNHFTHDHVVEFSDDQSSTATGLVNSHAEVVRNHVPMLTSLRYHDQYRHEEGRWRFHVRSLEFFYYLEPKDYVACLTGTLRNRAYAEPRTAEYPEGRDTWQSYYRDHPHR